jgi:hypothetical protein
MSCRLQTAEEPWGVIPSSSISTASSWIPQIFAAVFTPGLYARQSAAMRSPGWNKDEKDADHRMLRPAVTMTFSVGSAMTPKRL